MLKLSRITNLVSLVEEVFESQEIRAKDKKIKLRFDESLR